VKPQLVARPVLLPASFRHFSTEQQPSATADDADKLFKSIEIELRGVDPAVLKSYTTFATTAAQHLGIELGKW
jgi:small subunit ribosomal protein S10